MTTIAFRDGVMAADSLADFNGRRHQAVKIHRVGDALLGICGHLADCLVFVEWWRDGAPMDALPVFRTYGPDDVPDVTVLVARAGALEMWSHHFEREPVEMPFWAVGTAAAAALGAMHMGAAAAKAVEIAALVDMATGGRIQIERL